MNDLNSRSSLYLEKLIVPLADSLGLPKLPPNSDVIFFSFLLFLSVHQVFAPAISRKLFPVAFGKAGRKTRNNWSIHVVSQVHALIIIPLAARCLSLPNLDRDRAFGYDGQAGFVQAVACGYFLWDSLDAIINFTDIGFVIHGLACLAIFTLSFKPFLAYYGVRCLFWESSTFFLNIHWFLDKTGQTGSKFQYLNGIFLLSTFFGIRIVYGGKTSYDFFHTLYNVREQIPLSFVVVYGLGNIILQALNWLWFAKMIAAMRKRFSGTRLADTQLSNGRVINGTNKHR